MQITTRITLLVLSSLLALNLHAQKRQDDLRRPSIQLLPTDTIRGAVGAEDIVIDDELGIAYISSDDRYASFHEEPVQGAIFSYDLTAETPVLRYLTTDFPGELHPHGISLYIAPTGERRLFVVNHQYVDDTYGDHRIEVFAVKGDSLKHLKTHQSPKFRSPNSVYGVGLDEFYVTNDRHSKGKFGRFWEYLFRRKISRITHCKDGDCRFVAKGISFANGIAGNADNSSLYVTGTLRGRLHAFDREPSTGNLTRINAYKVGTGLDNLRPTGDGRLLTVAHPKLLKFVRHAQELSNRSPWVVYSIDPKAPKGLKVEEVFRTDGKGVSGASVCAVWREYFIIGTVFEDTLILGTIIRDAK